MNRESKIFFERHMEHLSDYGVYTLFFICEQERPTNRLPYSLLPYNFPCNSFLHFALRRSRALARA